MRAPQERNVGLRMCNRYPPFASASHTGHEWVERKLGDAGHPVHLQQVHYGHVAALGYRWPPDIAELINLNATHFPDCSKPKDRTGYGPPLCF